MSIISLIIILVIIGAILWAINTYVPMQEGIKKIMNIAVIILVCLWLLQVSGLLNIGGDSLRFNNDSNNSSLKIHTD